MLIDISRPIHGKMAIYPGNPPVQLTSGNWLTAIEMGSHTGTHIDAPLHIQAEGAGIEGYSLETFIGEAELVEVLTTSVITAHDLPSTTSTRVLIKTINSAKNVDEFFEDFIALDESAAHELVDRGVKLVGIDALSIKKRGVKDNVHRILIDAGVVIVEGLWLADVQPGHYELMCLPLPIPHIDGVPARAVLAPLAHAH